jgi:SAM-dependent methyltransferase
MFPLHESCIVCKGKDIYLKYIINEFHLLKCRHCSLLFVGEKLSPMDLKIYYEKLAENYAYTDSGDNMENLKFYYYKLADLILKKISRGRVLDVGCSSGGFLDCLPGWERHGIELDYRYAEQAKIKYGNNIHIGTLDDYQCAEGYFDVIALQDVLDHMPDPLQALAKCNALLKPDGLFVVKVHDISCLFAKLMGKNFYALIPPVHVVYFNRMNLFKALNICGFEVKKCWYLPQLLFFKTIFYRLAKNNTQNVFYFFYRIFNRYPFKDVKIKKNLYDIVTVFAKKKIVDIHQGA